MEKWASIPNTNGFYNVSDNGSIMRVVGYITNNNTEGKRKVGGNILKEKTKKNGYKEVNLHLGGNVSKMMYVHRAVALAFIGDIPSGYAVNHKDGNKANNKLPNLEIVSYSENSKHAIELGLHTAPVYHGSKHGMAKLNESQVLEIRKLYTDGKTPTELATEFNTPFGTICKICYRQTWKHI